MSYFIFMSSSCDYSVVMLWKKALTLELTTNNFIDRLEHYRGLVFIQYRPFLHFILFSRTRFNGLQHAGPLAGKCKVRSLKVLRQAAQAWCSSHNGRVVSLMPTRNGGHCAGGKSRYTFVDTYNRQRTLDGVHYFRGRSCGDSRPHRKPHTAFDRNLFETKCFANLVPGPLIVANAGKVVSTPPQHARLRGTYVFQVVNLDGSVSWNWHGLPP